VIAVVAEHQPRKTFPKSVLFINALGSGYGKVSDEETAFGGSRAARFNVFFIAKGEDSEQLSADRAWVRTFSDAMRPHAIGGGSYLNVMAVDEDRVPASYGPAKYKRLARIKSKYDPDNVFHHNANI
jgi:trans-2-enoyl-CoA reductase